MEGDAGASRLNPTDPDPPVAPEEMVEDRGRSETRADLTSPEEMVEDRGRSETRADQADSPEPVEKTAGSAAATPSILAGSRLDRRRLAGISAALVLVSVAVAVGGYLGSYYHRVAEQTTRDNAAAVAAAKECVLATQIPDVTDPTAAATKIFECATETGQFRLQAGAGFYAQAESFVQAYQAAQAHVKITEVRAAAERTNKDGSVDVLVAFRGTVDNVEVQGREIQFRLRAQMARENGQYKVVKLDQVAK